MECVSCKSKKFYKNDSGYYICLVCYSQFNSQTLKNDTFSSTPKSLKRKVNTKDKSKDQPIKGKTNIVLTWNEYKSHYLSLLTHCTSSLCNSIKLKQDLIPCSASLFNLILPEIHPELIFPKNRRKRLKSNQSKYPKNPLNFMERLKARYGDLSDKNLNKLLKPLIPENPLKLKRPEKLLKLFRTIESEVEVVNSEIPIELSLILVIIYLAALYLYSDTRGILVGDIIEWCYSGSLPYLKGYKILNLPKGFHSLFRPLSIPSSSWIRKKVVELKIESFKSFRTYFPFIYNLFITVCNRLRLQPAICELGYKLYLRTVECSICQINSNALPENIVAAHVIVVLKLLYGLNDCCYLIDLQKSSQKLVKNQKKIEVDEKSGPYSVVSGLPSICSVIGNWIELCKKLPVANQYFNVAGLDEVFKFVEENAEQTQDKALIIDTESEDKVEDGFKIQQKLLTRNHDIVKEFQYYKSKGKLKLPAQDYWVQKKKTKDKDYPFDYLFTLHCVCALCGELNTSEVNFICDRLDRFIKKYPTE